MKSMGFIKRNLKTLFFIITAAWYFIIFLIPYNTLANLFGIVNLGNGHSWPLSFFLMDSLVIVLIAIFVIISISALKKKQYQWLLLGVFLIYPLITIWATLQDLIFNPIAP